MANHIEQRANLWYAVLTIPKDVRETLGKMKFIQSLGTADKRQALIRSAPLISIWRTQIDEARGNTGAVANEALRWKGYLNNASGVQQDVLEDSLRDKALSMVNDVGEARASDFYHVAKGLSTPLNSHFEKWEAQIQLVAKTKDQTVKDVKVFLKRFSTIEKVTKQEAKKWVEEILAAGNSVGTANRYLISSRNYWKYLQRIDAVNIEDNPLVLTGFLPAIKKKNKKSYIPFEPEAVVLLWKEATKKKDQILADLIFVAAYTGARIEELCSIRIKDITPLSIKIVDSKTNAGIREVPLHNRIEETITRLKTDSKDGYLFTGLSANQYDDRSDAIGKRFGRLKTGLGFRKDLEVFHSIRKTFVTQLENAGVIEGVSADIVGHEKTNITYNLYSGGNSLVVKKEAIEKVSYPSW